MASNGLHIVRGLIASVIVGIVIIFDVRSAHSFQRPRTARQLVLGKLSTKLGRIQSDGNTSVLTMNCPQAYPARTPRQIPQLDSP